MRATGGHSTRGYTSLSGSDSPSSLKKSQGAAKNNSLSSAKKRVRFSQNVSVVRPPTTRLTTFTRHSLGAIGALAIRERYGEGSDSLYATFSPKSHALRRQRQGTTAAVDYHLPPVNHRTVARRSEGVGGTSRSLGSAATACTSSSAVGEEPVRVKMLSYMLPVEEKVNFTEGDASSFTPLSEDRSPITETKPLLGDDKLASLGEPIQLESPSTEEAKLIMEEREKEKTQDPEGEVKAGSEDRSPAASDDKSVFSETLASPGSDDRSIIKTSASTKPSLKRSVQHSLSSLTSPPYNRHRLRVVNCSHTPQFPTLHSLFYKG